MVPVTATLVLVLYYGALASLVAYAAHRLWLTVLLVTAARRVGQQHAEASPAVTVQLPMFNERNVAERLIRAAAALDYPAGRLEIQVLDDSTDETRGIVDGVAAELSAAGTRIEVVRRDGREGFKAGALRVGAERARGELIAVFDADFVPPPDFLRRTVPHFTSPRLGMVQARWEHLNRCDSLLTRAQSVLLDGHFVVEQAARALTGRFFNFNGTAGVWRRETIIDAGGWQHDTLTEDLDLSYRAQLRGWRFAYVPDLCVPAEVPADIAGYRSQQHRWAKGSVETLIKLSPLILRAGLPFAVWRESLVHLTANVCYPLTIVVAVLMPLQLLARGVAGPPWLGQLDATLLAVGLVSIGVFYGVSLWRSGREPRAFWVDLPAALAVDIGLSVEKTRAVIEALLRQRSPFVRTPKNATTRAASSGLYREEMSRRGGPELLLAASSAAAVGLALASPHVPWATVLFGSWFALGFAYVGALSVLRSRPGPSA